MKLNHEDETKKNGFGSLSCSRWTSKNDIPNLGYEIESIKRRRLEAKHILVDKRKTI